MRTPGCGLSRASRVRAAEFASASVDIAIPVYNEQRALPGSVSTLHSYLVEHLAFPWTITVVDNASTDRTAAVAQALAERYPRVRVLRLNQKGKGRAVRAAWLHSDADVLVYMDVDLSTSLDALLPLVAPLVSGHSDLAVGSRHRSGSRVVRSGKRELLSRGYNALLRLVHGVRFSDAQCGFKAGRADVVRRLLPKVVNNEWFFDTELLLLAVHNGLRVHEVAVDWVEDIDSRVDLIRSIWMNLRGVLRLVWAKRTGAARVGDLPIRPGPQPTHPDAVVRGHRASGPDVVVRGHRPARRWVRLGVAVAFALGAALLTAVAGFRASSGRRAAGGFVRGAA
ncbi:MAG TPA: dolichyl-phosphate beta-glucosyltransferase [Micromonosporaceae bacterium]